MKNILKKIFSTDSVISFGIGYYDPKEDKKITHNVTSIRVDSSSSTTTVIIEKGIEVSSITLSMELAEEIGFINVKALKDYCL